MTNSTDSVQQLKEQLQVISSRYNNGQYSSIEAVIADAASVGIQYALDLKCEIDKKYEKIAKGGNL